MCTASYVLPIMCVLPYTYCLPCMYRLTCTACHMCTASQAHTQCLSYMYCLTCTACRVCTAFMHICTACISGQMQMYRAVWASHQLVCTACTARHPGGATLNSPAPPPPCVSDARSLMAMCHQMTEHPGSATCILAVMKPGGMLDVANLGDSGEGGEGQGGCSP